MSRASVALSLVVLFVSSGACLADARDQCEQKCVIQHAQCLKDPNKTPNQCGAQAGVCYGQCPPHG